MKISITKKFTFDAAHQLYIENDNEHNKQYYGICGTGRNHEIYGEMPHGHTYHLEVTITGTDKDLSEDGMLINFTDLKKIVNDIIVNQLDHTFLNKTVKPLYNNVKHDNLPFITTAEVMSIIILRNINKHMQLLLNPNLKCTKVVLYETPNSYAIAEDD